MSTIYGTQLEPFEEIQSPSPTETSDNPYEATLAARSSSLPKRRGSGPPSPVNTVNTLHRQLSGDPESPPPAWKRRPTVKTRQSRSPPGPDSQPKSPPQQQQPPRSPTAVNGDSSSPVNHRSPSQSSVKSRNSLNSPNSGIRRPPHGLMMTTASPKPAVPLANGMFLRESPNGSSTSLTTDHDLALPNPAFRRRAGNGSNRSSIASSQDLGSLTSEELWSLGQEQDIPDMSNPLRQAAERPLDTVRRESRRLEREQSYHGGIPSAVIWPTAPQLPIQQQIQPNIKSKSFTNVATLNMTGRRASRRTKSRQSSIDVGAMTQKEVDGLYMHNASQPASPGVNGMGVLSSAHSSSTSLASQGLPPNKSFASLNGRPPSTYYSRDFLSSLAPREGGYAIAAQMGGGLGAVGTMSVEEKRRSVTTLDDGRSRTMGSRAPPSKSAGMGRWSLDGGENYGRPYGTPSAATTSSNLSAPPINSAEPSPSAEEITPSLPVGASAPYTASSTSPGPSIPVSTTPPNPSPLAQQNSADRSHSSVPTSSAPPPPPAPAPPISASSIAAPAAVPALNNKKSKKQLAKENKALEKAEAQKVARQRAEAARAEALKKQAEREEAKRKEKEEKARKKAEKKAAKKGKKSTPAPVPAPTSSATQPPPKSNPPPKFNPPIPAQHTPTTNSTVPNSAATSTAIPPTQSIPTSTSTPTSGTPFPKPIQSSQSAYKVPVRETNEAPRQTHHSMPLNAQAPTSTPRTQAPSQSAPARPPMEGKRSLFGTIKKRFSFVGSSGFEPKGPQVKDTPPPVPKVPTLPASPVTQQKPQANGDSAAKPVANDALPPRGESLAATTSIPQSPRSGPVEQASVSSSSTKDTVQPQPQSETSPRSQTQAQVPSTPSNLILGKTLSREGTASPPSSSTRKRNSLHGPRPMPNGVNGGGIQSRPSSIVTHESNTDQQRNAQPFDQQNIGGGPVTPSTTGDSTSVSGTSGSFFLQSHNSHMTNITPITSAEDYNDEVASGNTQKDGVVNEFEPKREKSGDSNETVHGGRGIPVNHNQPILA